MNKSVWLKRLVRAEWALALLYTAIAVQFHWSLFRSVGALWRDEIGIINIAMIPTFAERWSAIFHDHCPLLFPTLIRVWSAITGGATDAHLHWLGFIIGLCLVTMFWTVNRGVGRGLPLLSLSLVALNSSVLYFGDSLRAYGLASTLGLLAFFMMWRFVKTPCPGRWIAAAVAAVLAVQTLYPVAFLVLAMCAGGVSVGWRRRNWKTIGGVLAVGLTAALSLAPYVQPIRHSQQWWVVSQAEDSLPNFLNQMYSVVGADRNMWFISLWFAIVLLTITLGLIFAIGNPVPEVAPGEKELVLFSSVAMIVAFAGYATFFYLSKMYPQLWYFLPVLCFLVVCCDLVLPRIHVTGRVAIAGVSLVTVVLVYPMSNTIVHQRRTNVDLVAARVSQQAAADDLIIVCPWHSGITFARYYTGKAPWTAIPPFDDFRFHRYELVRAAMESTNDVIEPVLSRAAVTLGAGHRVWIVGDIQGSDIKPSMNPPRFNPLLDQNEVAHYLFWADELKYFLVQHAGESSEVDVPVGRCNPLEKVRIVVASGWREHP